MRSGLVGLGLSGRFPQEDSVEVNFRHLLIWAKSIVLWHDRRDYARRSTAGN